MPVSEVNDATLLLCLKVSRLQLLIDDDFDPDWLVGTLFLIYFHQVVKQFVANINNLDSHQRQSERERAELHSIFISALINKQQFGELK